jgi:hypothetical protein
MRVGPELSLTSARPKPLRHDTRALALQVTAAVGFYGVGPFGFEPQVLCMMMSSSGDAGTRGERNVCTRETAWTPPAAAGVSVRGR